MKIVYVDNYTGGHHSVYLKNLIEHSEYECRAVLPNRIDGLNIPQYIYSNKINERKSVFAFYKWCKQIKEYVDKERPDIVHFLYGDMFYRFFGVGLHLFKEYKTILTMHWAKDSMLGRISTKFISLQASKIIVHSEYFKQLLYEQRIENVAHIEYPQFNSIEISCNNATDYWNISGSAPVLVSLGSTRYDKGLDILLEALKNVKTPFQLLIAGKTSAFNEKIINEKIIDYKEKVSLNLRYITEEEFAMALSVADFIVLPYRKKFNGASGPLGEGVWRDKCIIGSNHGILGYTIERYHLGYTFESENCVSLCETIEKALNTKFEIDEQYLIYKKALNVSSFASKYSELYYEICK